MRTLALLFLLCASSYGADVTTTNIVGDIATKVSQRTTKDGKHDMRIETVYRGGKKILQTISQPNKHGKLVITSHGCYVGGDLVMSEGRNVDDAAFTYVTVYHPGTDDFEIFHRQPGGLVKPVSTKYLELTKKQLAVSAEFMQKMFEKTNVSDQEISDSTEQAQQKIQDLEKQKKDDK